MNSSDDLQPAADLRPTRRPRRWLPPAGAAAVATLAIVGWLWNANLPADAPSDSSTTGSSAPGQATAPTGKPTHALSDAQLQRMVEQAREAVARDPADSASWAMLAHSYDMLGKFAESSKAYATLAALRPGDAQVLADYADALAVANGRRLAGEPAALVARALKLDPANPKALALAGSAAFERAAYGESIDLWQRARRAAPDDTVRAQIASSIAAAEAAAKGETAAPKSVPAPATGTTSTASVSGRVTLSDDFIGKAPPEATVFIFARPATGSRMPVALLRKQVRDLPLDFTLDDSRAMVRDVKLSQVRTVVVGARVSRRGDVTPQPGDMQGWSAPVALGATDIKLEISELLR